MADVHDKKTRSYNMSQIRSKNTKPEMLVRRFLHSNGFRYRLHVKALPGRPDIVLRRYKIVIFVHGCFWHMHGGCQYSSIPTNNREYWEPKLNKNKLKDQELLLEYKKRKWQALVLWGCELKTTTIEKTMARLLKCLR